MSGVEAYFRLPDAWQNFQTGEVLRGGLESRPSELNTGWAASGVEGLAPYTGTHYITTPTVLDSVDITFPDAALFIRAPVKVTRSNINCFIDCTDGGSLVLEDSNVNAPPISNPALGYEQLTVRRCDIRGGQHSILGSNRTKIVDSILHLQYNDPDALDGYHNNAYISNGGSDVTLLHNTLDCSTVLTPANNGGPTGDASIFGDFGPLTRFTFDGNFFMPTTGSYGLSAGYNPIKPYGANPSFIVVRNNIFARGLTGKNGLHGPVTSFLASGEGNVWENNRYDDGVLIGPDGEVLDA